MPVSFINLIGKDHEFKKASYGFEGKTSPLEMSFCQYTIMQDEILEIKDTHTHELFKRNPNVTGDLDVRYYAGIPLKCPVGLNAGTLCLVDHRPNELTSEQKDALYALSEEIISRFECNAAQKKLEELNREKDELIKIVSLDMRNQLFGIEYLINEIENNEHREILEHVKIQENRCLDLSTYS